MSLGIKRAIAAAGTIVVAAMLNIATGTLTQQWATGWWVFTGTLVLIGGGLQAWLSINDRPTGAERPAGRQHVQGVKVSGGLSQKMKSVGDQEVTDSSVGTDLSQEQG
jgi:hypothetical protein